MSTGVGLRRRFEVLRRCGFACVYCGQRAPVVTLEVDHVVPRAAGGTNRDINLVAACSRCNRGKSDSRDSREELSMPVQLKRVNGIDVAANEPEEPALDLRAVGMEQLEAHRRDFFDAAHRFARGVLLWEERGWEWVEPDWSAPVEEWPPLARLLWVFDAMGHAAVQVGFLKHMPGHPGWCRECHEEGAARPEGFSVYQCMAHTKPEVIANMARGLFGAVAER